MDVSCVLLTGASGVLGSALRRTADGHDRIWSLVHRTPIEGQTVQADLRSAEEARSALRQVRPAIVVHAAYDKNEASIVDATGNLVEACVAVGVQRLVHCSTESVFGGAEWPRRADETPQPADHYGAWKLQAEHIVGAAPLETTIVRLPLLVSLDPPSADVVAASEHISGRRVAHWYQDEWRPPAWATDVARAIWTLVAIDHPPDLLHLPGPEVMSRWELARRIARRLGHDPDSAGEPVVRPDTRSAPRRLDLDDSVARSVLGWNPEPI